MPAGVNDIRIVPVRGHWEAYVNGEFFCSADSYLEAAQEIQSYFGG